MPSFCVLCDFISWPRWFLQCRTSSLVCQMCAALTPVFPAGVSSVGGAVQAGIRPEQHGEQPSVQWCAAPGGQWGGLLCSLLHGVRSLPPAGRNGNLGPLIHKPRVHNGKKTVSLWLNIVPSNLKPKICHNTGFSAPLTKPSFPVDFSN